MTPLINSYPYINAFNLIQDILPDINNTYSIELPFEPLIVEGDNIIRGKGYIFPLYFNPHYLEEVEYLINYHNSRILLDPIPLIKDFYLYMVECAVECFNFE